MSACERWFSCLLIAPVFAAVDGVVVNGTTGQPQPNAIVSLIQPAQGGMKTLGQRQDRRARQNSVSTTDVPRARA